MKAIVRRKISRPGLQWIRKFRKVPTSIISDCLNRAQATDGSMKPIYDGIRLCGPAVTIQSMSGNNLMSHLALTFAKAGDVLVIDARGCLGQAVWGGIQALYARKRHIAGLVLDGLIRDVEEMRRKKFPVYCKGVTPAGPHKGWADNVNIPIQCGGMPVSPGDLIVGDDDGVVAVPQGMLADVYSEARKRIRKEKNWVLAINGGKSSLDAVGLRKNLESFEIEYVD
jgi:regulator of RNase E activity RraA